MGVTYRFQRSCCCVLSPNFIVHEEICFYIYMHSELIWVLWLLSLPLNLPFERLLYFVGTLLIDWLAKCCMSPSNRQQPERMLFKHGTKPRIILSFAYNEHTKFSTSFYFMPFFFKIQKNWRERCSGTKNCGPSMRDSAKMSNRQREAEIQSKHQKKKEKKGKVVLITHVHRDI